MTRKYSVKHIFTCLLLAVATLAMTSCHSTRTATVTSANGGWHDVYMPVKVKVNSPMSMSLSGKATIVRDSLVNLSMRVLGMEVAVVNMTNDSIVLVDKYHKYLFSESMANLMGSHKLTLGDIQDIMLGLNSNAPLNQLSFNNPGSEKPVVATFSDFEDTPAGKMAQTVTVEAPLKKNDVEAQLIWSAASATWNTGRSVDFTTPVKGYKQISLDKALSIFKSM
jgi:hypothetical protein